LDFGSRAGKSAVPPEQAVPPFPDPEDPAVRAIIDMAMEALGTGELDAQGAVRYAAVHGWLEGHLEGEECKANCVADPAWQDRRYP
jgi:hypothetical protein